MQGYFDYAATTMPDPDVARTVYEAMLKFPGNPSSRHALGFESAKALQKARKRVAELMGVDEKEIFFTSGGTEGNNLLIQGAAAARRKQAPEILYSGAEHASVVQSVLTAGSAGSQPVKIQPDRTGHLSADDFMTRFSEKTGFVTLMKTNNETGAVNPVEDLAREIKSRQDYTLVHTDLVSSLGKMPLAPGKMGVDMATFSGHKIFGPNGVGFIYLKKGTHIRPWLVGGEQQEGIRPGTENLPAVLGMTLALEKALTDLPRAAEQAGRCKQAAMEILNAIPTVTYHNADSASPFLLHLSTNTVKSETMLNYLSGKGFFISAGSACAKGAQSHVLQEMGLAKKESDTALRISFSGVSDLEDTVEMAKTVVEGERLLCHAY